jgi:signal transduction histidine kinase
VALDVTDSVRGREALLEADRRKDELLAKLADGLRAPLAPIRTTLDALRDAGAAPALLAQLEQQLTRIEELADGLPSRPSALEEP